MSRTFEVKVKFRDFPNRVCSACKYCIIVLPSCCVHTHSLSIDLRAVLYAINSLYSTYAIYATLFWEL